jgi:hypothetical protein
MQMLPQSLAYDSSLGDPDVAVAHRPIPRGQDSIDHRPTMQPRLDPSEREASFKGNETNLLMSELSP